MTQSIAEPLSPILNDSLKRTKSRLSELAEKYVTGPVRTSGSTFFFSKNHPQRNDKFAGSRAGTNRIELPLQPLPHQQTSQTEQKQPRLPARYIPKQSRRFIPVEFAQRLPGRAAEQVHQFRVILLLKVVQRTADQPMRAEFSVQRGQLSGLAILQKRLRYAQRPAKSSHDPSDGGYFHLREM